MSDDEIVRIFYPMDTCSDNERLIAIAIGRAIYRKTLEEAAKVCDEKSKDYDADFEPARAAAAWHCVNAIRALAASDSDGGKDE